MDSPHQQQNGEHQTKGNFLCRQSSTRWTPTSEQIRILKDLYYNNGIRSPTAEQIQRISARLRQYGKIEGKNVFYWFQNHKARERQKKRFNTANTEFSPVASYNKYPPITPTGFPSSSSSCSTPGVVGVGSYTYGYGSVTMEKSFRNCSISTAGETLGHNTWTNDQNSYSYHHFIDHQQRKLVPVHEDVEENDDHNERPLHELETLPLFPLSGGGCYKPESDSCYASIWHHEHMAYSHSASLELSLNSYTGRY